ncbi:hypothetical protein F5884DRAFT_248811 [Xylogone sp. PMI_703]|nr:hypothetical protein F5884DRAFT_248811 [Xylogone sp. PMI_703]
MISDDIQLGNVSFARQLYLHSLTYLLRALPPDLTAEEQLGIRGALPEGLVLPLRIQLNPAESSSSALQHNAGSTGTPSFLHRTVASTILNLFILLHFLLPYLKALLANAFEYERRHKISERVLSHGIDLADAWGKRRVTITEAISGIADGKVGRVIGETGSWIVEEVIGGLNEGVGEGIAIFGITRNFDGERS